MRLGWGRGFAAALGFAALLPGFAAGQEPEAAAPGAAATKRVRIYGVELQAGAERDRVLVFAEQAPEAELVTLDAGSVELRLRGAVLEPSAATRIKPEVGGAVSEVNAFVPAGGGEVRIRIERSPGAVPELSRRGAIIAVEFPLPPGLRDTGLTLSFVDAELAEVVRDVAKATGASFIFDERLQGRVTISVVERVSAAEAIEILHSALLSKGYAAVPSPGGAWRILPAGEAGGAAPVREGALRAERAAPVTTRVRLRNADAAALVAQLAPWSGSDFVVAPHEPTNSVILSASEGRVQRYLTLLQSLDAAEARELAVITLRNREAAEIAEQLDAVLAPAEGEPASQVEVWHDERTNSVLIRAPAARLAELRESIRLLDRPPADDGEIRVIRPLHADVTKLAETLTQLQQGDARAATANGAAALGLLGEPFHVAPHVSTNALLVQADPATHLALRALIEEIDRRPPSIAVDLMVLEITLTDSLALGLDAFVPFGDADDPDETAAGAIAIQSGAGGVFRPIADPGVGFLRYARAPLVIPVIGPGGVPIDLIVPREIVQITAAEGIGEARTLLRPHLVALAGEEHELVAGDNVPVLVGATESAVPSDPLTIRNNIERRDVGTILRVRPTAGQEGDVRLEIEVEVSRLRQIPAAIAARSGPVIEQRKLQAVTTLEHGQVAVLGMVLEQATMQRDRGVPFLKDIPILGWWARSTTDEKAKRSLVIAVQAGIERSPAERLADSVRHRLAFERSLARHGPLAIGEDGFALLVTTRATRAEADAVAAALTADGVPLPRVVAWSLDGTPRFDVYAGAFPTLGAAGNAAAPLVAYGWKPEVVALPPAEVAAERGR